MRVAIAAALLAAAVALGACGGNDHKSRVRVDAEVSARQAAAGQAGAGRHRAGRRPGHRDDRDQSRPLLARQGRRRLRAVARPLRGAQAAALPPGRRLGLAAASPDGPIDWTKASDGCMRGMQPCRPYNGIRDTLRAIRSQQQAGNGFATMVVLYGVPEWAAVSAHGCERDGIAARSRPINAQGLEGYKKLVASLQDLARREGVDINWWSPWNEPNGPFFISPQREQCKGSSKSLAPAVYAKLARAMRTELEARPADGRRRARRPEERAQVRHLDLRVLRRPARRRRLQRRRLRPAPVLQARRRRRRPRRRGRAREGPRPPAVHEGQADLGHRERRRRSARRRQRSPKDESIRADCQALNVSLRRWNNDPRVDAVFQYTFRDDPVFPVGLADAKLSKAWPAYELFKAWGGQRRPDDPAPALPKACRA